MAVKKFPLKFIQVAWVAETIGVILFHMMITILLPTDRIGLWIQSLPLISGLIIAQGSAASIGPAVADKTRANSNNNGGKNE